MSMTTSPSSQDRSTSPAARGGRQVLMDYWLVLVQRRWIIVSCLGLVVLATGILSLLATPRYRATTTLQIDRKGPDILSFTAVMGMDSSYAAYQDFYQTHISLCCEAHTIRGQADLTAAAQRHSARGSNDRFVKIL